jgi:hypothetical protein
VRLQTSIYALLRATESAQAAARLLRTPVISGPPETLPEPRKRCSRCGEEKTLPEFRPGGAQCRRCYQDLNRDRQRARRAAQREQAAEPEPEVTETEPETTVPEVTETEPETTVPEVPEAVPQNGQSERARIAAEREANKRQREERQAAELARDHEIGRPYQQRLNGHAPEESWCCSEITLSGRHDSGCVSRSR